MSPAFRLCALLLLCLPGLAVHGAETERAEISFEGRTYQYTFIARLKGDSNAVHAVVTDFEHMQRINDDIVESRVLQRYQSGELKRLLKLRHCILMFCFDMDFVERVHESPGHITTVMVPEESTFSDGTASWQIEAVDKDHTRVSVSARQTPRFWIPPVLGPIILKRVFMSEVAETCANIERIVNAGYHSD
jgi:hypothetical protein